LSMESFQLSAVSSQQELRRTLDSFERKSKAHSLRHGLHSYTASRPVSKADS
jgi:hypothetical protein